MDAKMDATRDNQQLCVVEQRLESPYDPPEGPGSVAEVWGPIAGQTRAAVVLSALRRRNTNPNRIFTVVALTPVSADDSIQAALDREHP